MLNTVCFALAVIVSTGLLLAGLLISGIRGGIATVQAQVVPDFDANGYDKHLFFVITDPIRESADASQPYRDQSVATLVYTPEMVQRHRNFGESMFLTLEEAAKNQPCAFGIQPGSPMAMS